MTIKTREEYMCFLGFNKLFMKLSLRNLLEV